MPPAGFRVCRAQVCLEDELHARRADEARVPVLHVAAKLMPVPRKQFRVAQDGKVQDLANDTRDAAVASLQGEHSGLDAWCKFLSAACH